MPWTPHLTIAAFIPVDFERFFEVFAGLFGQGVSAGAHVIPAHERDAFARLRVGLDHALDVFPRFVVATQMEEKETGKIQTFLVRLTTLFLKDVRERKGGEGKSEYVSV